MRYPIALFCAALTAFACDSPTRPDIGGATRTALPTTVVLSLQTSGLDAPRRLVFYDQESWASFWDQATRNLSPQPGLPAIDFNESMVIAAAMGYRSTGGHTISIERVTRRSGQLQVEVREVTPGASCVTSPAGTSPVVAVRIPRREGLVHFEVEQRVQSCS